MPLSLDRGIVNTSVDELGYACTSQAAAAASTSDIRQRCVRPDGQDRLTDAYAGQTKDCRQLNVISDIKTGDYIFYNGLHRRFAYATLSQIGYNDNHSSSPNEGIGIAWDDATGWAYRGGWQAGRYDVYWCNGSEYQPTPSHPWVHNVFEATAQDQYTPWASLGPYGQSMVEARQWKRSTGRTAPPSAPSPTSGPGTATSSRSTPRWDARSLVVRSGRRLRDPPLPGVEVEDDPVPEGLHTELTFDLVIGTGGR